MTTRDHREGFGQNDGARDRFSRRACHDCGGPPPLGSKHKLIAPADPASSRNPTFAARIEAKEKNGMPPPIKVELRPHDPEWSRLAEAEAQIFAKALGPCLLTVHHVGSTAIPGIHAKPILDLLPVVSSLAELDTRRRVIEALGYEWWGELGLPGRLYCTKADKETGRRIAQLHCYATGSSEITRHLAFRDYLRARPEIAAEYDRVKADCRSRHPDDSHAYSDCKGAWIEATEADALEWYQAR